MRAFTLFGAVLMANTVLARLPAQALDLKKLSPRASCDEKTQVACGDSCMGKETGEKCCGDPDDTICPINTDCVPLEGGGGVSCKPGGTTPNLGQFGDASFLDPQLPCGESRCFQPLLTNTCCSDGTVCINKQVCTPKDDGFRCCDPETEECGPCPVVNATTSAAPTSVSSTALPVYNTSTPVSIPVAQNTSCQTITKVTPKITSGVHLYSLPVVTAVPTAVPTASACFAHEDLKLLADTVVVLSDVLAKMGYCHAHPTCSGA